MMCSKWWTAREKLAAVQHHREELATDSEGRLHKDRSPYKSRFQHTHMIDGANLLQASPRDRAA